MDLDLRAVWKSKNPVLQTYKYGNFLHKTVLSGAFYKTVGCKTLIQPLAQEFRFQYLYLCLKHCKQIMQTKAKPGSALFAYSVLATLQSDYHQSCLL